MPVSADERSDNSFLLGHDGLVHAVRRDGLILCGMGRAVPVTYLHIGPATCLACYCRWNSWDYL